MFHNVSTFSTIKTLFAKPFLLLSSDATLLFTLHVHQSVILWSKCDFLGYYSRKTAIVLLRSFFPRFLCFNVLYPFSALLLTLFVGLFFLASLLMEVVILVYFQRRLPFPHSLYLVPAVRNNMLSSISSRKTLIAFFP